VIEAFTKLINVVGALNPGNFGTYEAGHDSYSATWYAALQDWTLGLCRRAPVSFLESMGCCVCCDVEINTASTEKSLRCSIRCSAVVGVRVARQCVMNGPRMSSSRNVQIRDPARRYHIRSDQGT